MAQLPIWGDYVNFGPSAATPRNPGQTQGGHSALGRDIVDEAEFVAGLDQAAEGVLRALKATNLWQKSFGKSA
jgi:hypothetical protein